MEAFATAECWPLPDQSAANRLHEAFQTDCLRVVTAACVREDDAQLEPYSRIVRKETKFEYKYKYQARRAITATYALVGSTAYTACCVRHHSSSSQNTHTVASTYSRAESPPPPPPCRVHTCTNLAIPVVVHSGRLIQHVRCGLRP